MHDIFDRAQYVFWWGLPFGLLINFYRSPARDGGIGASIANINLEEMDE